VILDVDGDKTAVELEQRVEGAEAVQVGGIEPPRRVREANVDDPARRVRPPGVRGAVGEPEVGREVAEEVERGGRRPQQVGPDALVVDALVRLDDRCAVPHCGVRGRRDEIRAGLARVVERQSAADRSRGLSFRRNRLRSDRMSLPLAPPCLVKAVAAAELRHLRTAGDLVLAVPAEGRLKFFTRGHGGARGHRSCWWRFQSRISASVMPSKTRFLCSTPNHLAPNHHFTARPIAVRRHQQSGSQPHS
jgi:hypothetical protein